MTTMTDIDIDTDTLTPEEVRVFDMACELSRLAASLVDDVEIGTRNVSPERLKLIRAAHAAAQAAAETAMFVIMNGPPQSA